MMARDQILSSSVKLRDLENVGKEYTIFEAKENYFKVRKQQFMKKTINWYFDNSMLKMVLVYRLQRHYSTSVMKRCNT